jgi:spore coat protein U-like protein
MKKIVIISALSILISFGIKGIAQTAVTGHVFAEVVEPLSASSQSQTSFTVYRNQTQKMDLGQIEVKSAASASCSIILGKANLTGNDRQQISLETMAFSNLGADSNAINGSQSISLQCETDQNLLDQNAISYKGDINIVLAYN